MRVVVISLLTFTVIGNLIAGDVVYRSPESIEVSEDGKTLYIAEYTSNTVAVYNLDLKQIVIRYHLEGPPSGLALSATDNKLYVTCAKADGTIQVVDLVTHAVKHIVNAGHSPASPVLDIVRQQLYVCNRFDNNISVIDLKLNKVTSTIPVVREPVAAVMNQDGSRLLVANHLPMGASDEDYIAAEISIIDIDHNKNIKSIGLPNGSTSVHGICLSADGKTAYVTHLLARYQLPATQIERGWINTNALSVIDMQKYELLNTVLLDNIDLGAANPWQPGCSEDGEYICVTHAGSHEVSIINQKKLLNKLSNINPAVSQDVPNDLSFLVGIREPINIEGNGPRGLAIFGNAVYVAEYFSDTIGIIMLSCDESVYKCSLPLGDKQKLTDLRKGEILFYNAHNCFQNWQSCASCHPGDGRVDGLNWDLLNDGMGNPKNTKSLLYSHQTPPAMSLGVRSTAEQAVRAGFKHIQFTVLPEAEAVAVDKYIKSLRPLESPYLAGGRLSDSAKRGKIVFEKAGCSSCHSGELFTDRQSHNLFLGEGLDEGKLFDTPTLIELWRTGPYLHDGRANTINEVLVKFNEEDKHGVTSNLTEKEVYELAEYLLSL